MSVCACLLCLCAGHQSMFLTGMSGAPRAVYPLLSADEGAKEFVRQMRQVVHAFPSIPSIL